VRPYISVYRTDEPQSTTGAIIPAESYSTAKLQYPSGPRNAESLFVDPLTNDVYILTKATSTEIYSAPASVFDNAGQTTVLTSQGVLGTSLFKATAADISPDGRHILVRSKTAAYMFERGAGQSVADALHGTGIPFTLGVESQGEAIGWAADAKSFYTTSESNDLPAAPIYSYAFATLTGDYNDNDIIDAADYTVWRDALNSGDPLENDSNGNGIADEDDFLYWRDHFGETLGSGAGSGAAAAAVPEPASIAMLWLAGVALACFGRSRS
jgi:hypothetical protein